MNTASLERRTVLKTTLRTIGKIVTGWIAVAAGVWAGAAHATPHLAVTQVILTAMSIGQADGSAKAPSQPSQIFSPLSLTKKDKAPSSDPFAGRSSDLDQSISGTSLTLERSTTPLPPVDYNRLTAGPAAGDPAQPPMGRATASDQIDSLLLPATGRDSLPGSGGGTTSQTAGEELLRTARKALALGDVRRASNLVQQARGQRANYDPLGDTPDKVEAAIQKYQTVMARQDSSEAFRRAYAKMLMEQSQALVKTRDYDEAERLVVQASRQQLAFGPLETKPDELLTQIMNARRTAPPQIAAPPATAAARTAPSGADAVSASQRDALELVRLAREALAANQLNRAEDLARRAEMLGLPDDLYGSPASRPGQILVEIRSARMRGDGGRTVAASANQVTPATGSSIMDRTASRAVYDAANDPTRIIPAANAQPSYAAAQMPPEPVPLTRPLTPLPAAATAGPGIEPLENIGMSLYRQGEEALKVRDRDRAQEFFQQAAEHVQELDSATAQRLKERLQLLATPPAPQSTAGPGRSLADETASKLSILARQVQTDVLQQESKAKAMRETDPKAALQLLEETRAKVESAGLDPAAREQLLRGVDRALADTKDFIDKNRARIELEEKNARTLQEVQRDQRNKVEIQDKVKLMVDEFNRLMDEQRYAEAEVVAKRAAELAPQDPIVPQLLWQAKFVRRFMSNKALQDKKEEAVWATLNDVENSAIPFPDSTPYQHGDAKLWRELSASRSKFMQDRNRRRSERELEIERKLRMPVSIQFTNAPLSKVMDNLAKITEVNLFLDPQGLAQEGVSTDTPVTIEIRNQIMLKSVLNLVLQPLHLSYVIKDEVLKITSEQLRDGQVYTVTYNVADLVIPIPNFVPNQRMGLAGAYHEAMNNAGMGMSNGFNGVNAPLAVVASKDGSQSHGTINPAVLAQMSGSAAGLSPMNMPMGFGPGGLGGGAQPDFDSLIDLITSTVHPSTWDSVGGPGTITRFEGNLSIVVSQTQDVHEEVADLLEQLRRLQDLQVTIECRFITLNDNFFERIGVDFDFNIDDNIDAKGPIPLPGFGAILQGNNGENPQRNFANSDSNGGLTVGLSGPTGTSPAPNFSADLDIPFRQNAAGLAVPQFGGFDATAGGTIGFAILSDIESYFFISAAQGDKRSNVLQAPKVTLFNGQQAYVSDSSQTPFVMSVVPVVGDFAAAQQPVIVVLSEGTHMTVQAVISNDRRFVRLTIVPFFSSIGAVNTFQFTGSQTSTTTTSAEGWVNPSDTNDTRRNNNSNNGTTTTTGTTVQLPTFSSVTVATTVSVPDGGTVLLGGIKRLREGRNEAGVPILNKVPYINRLFKNSGIGRETQSLMMMVTPRIIIQEEEEAAQTGYTTSP
jgi:general secretion pathway protein D